MYIWVEGDDDERLFEEIIKPRLQKKYNSVKVVCYAKTNKKKVRSFLNSIRARNNEYIYIADINRAPCITFKKQKIQNKLRNIDEDRIAVVVKEIEGWYLAGLGKTESKKLRIRAPSTTDNITKEQFNGLIPNKFRSSRIDFMREILKYFSTEVAKQKNKSFKYFIEKHNCEVSRIIRNAR